MSVHFDDKPGVADDHVVHFYEDDHEMVSVLAAYVREALEAEGSAVVIATKPHRRDLIVELGGVDVMGAVAAGRLTLLDAGLTKRALMPAGRIDPDAFRAVITPVVERAAEAGRPVHAFGEIVALLWDEGDIASVIELEALWNELASEWGFALLCAYPKMAVAGPEHVEALTHVCRLHDTAHGLTAVDEPAPVEVTTGFPATRNAPAAARRFLDGVLRKWGVDDTTLQDAVTVVSELATNAIVHADSGFVVSASSDGTGLRLEVRDESSARPAPAPGTPDAVSGRGLHVVTALARDWGVDAGPDGKTVWAELPG